MTIHANLCCRGAVCALALAGPAATQSNPILESTLITAADGDAGDHFGADVAIEGDTIAVGAPGADPAGVDHGAVYVFERLGPMWVQPTQTAVLLASDGQAGDLFGDSVWLENDVIFVGAPDARANGLGKAGAVYVFAKPPTGWTDMTETLKLTASDAEGNDRFGTSVAADADTLVVGARLADSLTRWDAGAVYVFRRTGTRWSQAVQAAILTAGSSRFAFTKGFRLGTSVAIDGDTIAAGADAGRQPINPAGAAYVFEKPAGGWTTATANAELVALDSAQGDAFGAAIDVRGDTIVVGATATRWATTPLGAAYVFERPSTGWVDTIATTHLWALGCVDLAIERDAIISSTSFSGPLSPFGGFGFPIPPSGWRGLVNPTLWFAMSTQQPVNRFGSSLDTHNGVYLFGAEHWSDNESEQGAACIFVPPHTPGLFPAPSIDSISPSNVQQCVSQPTTITLTGTFLHSVLDLTMGERVVTPIRRTWSSLTFSAPPGVPAGTYPVIAHGVGGSSNQVNLSYDPATNPSLSATTPSAISARQLPQSVTVHGTDLDCVADLLLNGASVPITARTSTSLTFSLGSVPIGRHSLTAVGATASNTVQVAVVGSHPSVLMTPTLHVGGSAQAYSVWSDAGWTALYLMSLETGPTALPGVITLEIGAGVLGNVFPVVAVTADPSGFAQAQITIPNSLFPPSTLQRFYWEVLTLDPTVPLGLQTPLETSNASGVLTTF